MFVINEITDLEAGIAGEHLVCAQLIMMGYRAFLTDQHCPYDVAVEKDGKLIRIQVKSTRKARAVPQRVEEKMAYQWHVRRAGKKGARVYGEGEFDMLALVALDAMKIAYMPPSKCKNTIHIRNSKSRQNKGYIFDQFTFESAVFSLLAEE